MSSDDSAQPSDETHNSSSPPEKAIDQPGWWRVLGWVALAIAAYYLGVHLYQQLLHITAADIAGDGGVLVALSRLPTVIGLVAQDAFSKQSEAITGFHSVVFWRWLFAGLAVVWMAGHVAIAGVLRLRFDWIPRDITIAELSAIPITLSGLLLLCSGLLSTSVLSGIVFLQLAVGLAAIVYCIVGNSKSDQSANTVNTPKLSKVLNFFTLFILVISFIYALAPATQSDGMRYHLGALGEWWKAGGITFLPHLSFAQFPFLVEMHFFAGFPLTGGGHLLAGVFAKVIHWCFILLTLCVFPALVAQLNRGATVEQQLRITAIARCLFATLPVAAILSGWSFIDHGITFFFLVSLTLVLRMYSPETLDSANRSTILAILAGIATGGLLGTKYTMLLTAGLFGLIVLSIKTFNYKQSSDKKNLPAQLIKIGFIFGLAAFLTGSPWLIKNLAQTGNPIYPASVGGQLPTPGWTEEANDLLKSSMARKGVTSYENGEPYIPGLITTLPALSANWKQYESHYAGLLPLLGVLSLLLIIAALGKSGDSRECLPWVATAFLLLISYIAWWYTYRSTRLLLPLLSVATISVASLIVLQLSGWLRRVGYLLLGGHMILCLIFLFNWLLRGQFPVPLPVAVGLQDHEVYLARSLNYYAHAQEVNQRAELTGGTTLLLGEHRPYYFETPILFADWFNPPIIKQLFEQHPTNEALLNHLRGKGVEYVLFNFEELMLYYHQAFLPRLTPRERERWEALVAYFEQTPPLPTPIADALWQQSRRANDEPRPPRLRLYQLK